MNSIRTEVLGDGVECQWKWTDGGCRCVFTVHGDEVAVSYLDEQDSPRVDVCERAEMGLDSFKQMLVVWVMAWSHAEQLAALARCSTQAAKPESICDKCKAPLVNGWECQCDPLGLNDPDEDKNEDCGPCPCGEPDCPNCRK